MAVDAQANAGCPVQEQLYERGSWHPKMRVSTWGC